MVALPIAARWRGAEWSKSSRLLPSWLARCLLHRLRLLLQRRHDRRRRWRRRTRLFRHRLLVPGQAILRPFPRHEEVEIAELLRQRDRLIDHALLGLGVTQLDVPGEG